MKVCGSVPLRAAFLLAICAAVSGIGSCSSETTIDRSALPDLVLQPEDVPGLARFDEGRQVAGDLPPGDRSDPERFGREDGWKARYRREGATAETAGPLVVESRADLFRDENGSERDVSAARADVPPGWELDDAPSLGDGAWIATTVQAGGAEGVRHYAIAWHDANVAAFLLVQGFDDRLTREDALTLARKQQARIEAAGERASDG